MPDMPYYQQLFQAVMANDTEAISRIIQECFVKMSHEFMGVVRSYDFNDRPVVVAVMKVMARTLELTLDESGQNFVEQISSMTSSVAIDLDEMIRQAKEERGNGKTEE